MTLYCLHRGCSVLLAEAMTDLRQVTLSFGFPATIPEVPDTGLAAPSIVDFTPAQFTDPDTWLDCPVPNLYDLTVLERQSQTRLLEHLPLDNQSTTRGDITIGLVNPIQDTTVCAVAIQLILHCNKKDLSMLEVDTRLRHGYRPLRSPLEGCRVNNWVLLTVLAELIQ